MVRIQCNYHNIIGKKKSFFEKNNIMTYRRIILYNIILTNITFALPLPPPTNIINKSVDPPRAPLGVS
jgi:hypothetical protein